MQGHLRFRHAIGCPEQKERTRSAHGAEQRALQNKGSLDKYRGRPDQTEDRDIFSSAVERESNGIRQNGHHGDGKDDSDSESKHLQVFQCGREILNPISVVQHLLDLWIRSELLHKSTDGFGRSKMGRNFYHKGSRKRVVSQSAQQPFLGWESAAKYDDGLLTGDKLDAGNRRIPAELGP